MPLYGGYNPEDLWRQQTDAIFANWHVYYLILPEHMLLNSVNIINVSNTILI